MKLNLKSGNQNLATTLTFPPKSFEKPLPALIFIHGWGSDQTGNIERAKELSKLGFVCLTLDLRGHGESDGKLEEFSRRDHLEDCLAAYDFLISKPEVNPKKIGVIGASYGGYLSAVATNFLKFKWLILRVPALYFNKKFSIPTAKLFNEDKDAFTTSGLKIENSLALKGVAKFPGEILIIESGKDKIIPHKVIENYLEVAPNKSHITHAVMKNTPHSLKTQAQEAQYIEILKNWLKKH